MRDEQDQGQGLQAGIDKYNKTQAASRAQNIQKFVILDKDFCAGRRAHRQPEAQEDRRVTSSAPRLRACTRAREAMRDDGGAADAARAQLHS